MKRTIFLALVIGFACVFAYAAHAAPFNGQADYELDLQYTVITGGKFVNGQTRTGATKAPPQGPGGVMAYITDDPNWGITPINVWKRDGWFSQTAGLALTMKNTGSIVYDNNGIETHTTNGFYHYATNANLAGLYVGWSMSNNYDWIYAGYFQVTEPTTVDTIIGYWNNGTYSGIPPVNPNLDSIMFRMNIWSENAATLPSVASFTGNIFSSDNSPGAFSWGDTGEDRVISDTVSRDIYYTAYALSSPLTLQPGSYYFSHDAVVTPLPGSLLLLGSGLLGLAFLGRRRLLKRR